MTYVCLALVVFLAYREWMTNRERQDWSGERQLLLTRIQAPELGVAKHMQDQPPLDLPSVNPFDDEDFRRAKEQMDQLQHDLGVR